MGLSGRRALFISYNGMFEPLGQTQVIPYLTELAKKGVSVTLLSFEKAKALLPEVSATDTGPGYSVQLWPHRHGTDAMFISVLRKLDG